EPLAEARDHAPHYENELGFRPLHGAAPPLHLSPATEMRAPARVRDLPPYPLRAMARPTPPPGFYTHFQARAVARVSRHSRAPRVAWRRTEAESRDDSRKRRCAGARRLGSSPNPDDEESRRARNRAHRPSRRRRL